MPEHQWEGTKLRFEKEKGIWGDFVELRGQSGSSGYTGGGASSKPQSKEFSYNGDGTVSSIRSNTGRITFTYNPDGTVSTVTSKGTTQEFTYNGDGTVNQIKVTG